jgi:hypothetical protein
MKIRDQICDDCPFRRNAPPGWLGANKPEEFVVEALSDRSTACHMMVDQYLPRRQWEQAEIKAPRCRGAITLMRNTCKSPRDPEMRDLTKTVPADRENVFSNSKEFVDHHLTSAIRSWEFD